MASRREALHRVIFGVDTPAGRAFDVVLLLVIVLSVLLVMLESVAPMRARFGTALDLGEWLITGIFSVEYVLRLACVKRPLRYALSFFGLVDLLAVLPGYLGLLLPGSESLLVIRALRLLRIFRVFKLARYLGEANVLVSALRASLPKVIVFLGTVLVLVVILGASMYLIEGPQHGFTSIPRGMYWAVVTMTTVGYGDITPQTVPGQLLSALAMLTGYSIIAVPTGIVSAEIVQAAQPRLEARPCPQCSSREHAPQARFCSGCGAALPARRSG